MSQSLAIIPARGGSKRIAGKNYREFAGKPMIAWSIEAALQSQVFDRVVVSTDDEHIKNVALEYGAECPFLRPAHLSDDHAGLMDVIQHAVNKLQTVAASTDLVACIYATAPFVRVEDLRAAVSLWRADVKADFVLAVCEFPSPIQRAFVKGDSQYLQFLSPHLSQTRSQDLEPAYHDAGQFILGRASAFQQYHNTMEGNTLAYPLPAIRCQDIDTPANWDHALQLWHYNRFVEENAA